jgi:hypothetical protein
MELVEMVTLEDIENEIDPSKQTGIGAKMAARMKDGLINNMIKRLKKQEDLLKEIPDVDGRQIIKALITGNRMLSADEYLAVQKKFGTKGIGMIDGLSTLNKAQKQYIFKRMGYDIGEVK